MRKFLFALILSGFVFIAFLFIYNQRKTYVSFNEVAAIEYNPLAHNQNVGEFIRVVKDNKWGVAKRKNGEVVLDTVYDLISDFYEGYATIVKDGKYGVIDENFHIVIKPKWKKIGSFHLGYAVVSGDNDKAGVIDVTGRVVIKPLYYDYITPFDHNLVAVATNYKDNKTVAIDVNGNVLKND